MLVLLGSVREQSKQALVGKPVSSITPWPLHHLLSLDSYPIRVPAMTSFHNEKHGNVSHISPILPNIMVVFHSKINSKIIYFPRSNQFSEFNIIVANIYTMLVLMLQSNSKFTRWEINFIIPSSNAHFNFDECQHYQVIVFPFTV